MRGLHWNTLLIYLDDVVVFSNTVEDHLSRLEEVFKRLRDAGLKLKPSKCELFKKQVHYLGHVVSEDGVSTDPSKIEAVNSWPVPRDETQVRAFLGLTGYYRRFIPHYADIARPLYKLLTKGNPFAWTPETQASFTTLQSKLASAPVLGYPDPKLPYILDTDASNVACGAVLSQLQAGVERPVAFFSKTFSSEERNYCVTRRELLAIVRAVKQFRPYLYGRPFRLRTDHESLSWMLRLKDPRGQVARWMEELQEFNYQLEHRKGASHGNADALSRRPCDIACRHCSKAEGQTPSTPSPVQLAANLAPSHAAAAQWTPPATPETTCSPAVVAESKQKESSSPEPELRLLRPIPEILRRQKTEEPIGRIYRAINTKTAIPANELAEGSPEFKKWARIAEHLSIREDGLLQYHVIQNERRITVIACPPTLRTPLIQEVHESSHLGEWKTTKGVQQNWYWPGMHSEVRRWVKACHTCQKSKNSGSKEANTTHHLYAGRPWQKIAIDFTGPLDTTTRGNKWILVITDHFTRWCDGIALPDATAKTVADALVSRVFNNFGLPESIHSDQGKQFESELIHEVCQQLNIDKSRTSPYRPSANGVCERINRTLADSLRAMLTMKEYDTTDWDLILPNIMQTLRATPHKITGETANFLMLGREVRLPTHVTHDVTLDNQTATSEYAQGLIARMRLAHDLLRNRQRLTRVEDSEEPPLFKEGDSVWLRSYHRKKGKCAKLELKFVGPYVVVEALPYHTYRLRRNDRETVQHEGRIKLHFQSDRPSGQILPRDGPREPVAIHKPRPAPRPAPRGRWGFEPAENWPLSIPERSWIPAAPKKPISEWETPAGPTITFPPSPENRNNSPRPSETEGFTEIDSTPNKHESESENAENSSSESVVKVEAAPTLTDQTEFPTLSRENLRRSNRRRNSPIRLKDYERF